MGLKESIKRWLEITPATEQSIRIDADLTHEESCFESRLWYRGSASEIEQFYKSITSIHDDSIRSRFWAGVPSEGNKLRKIHSGLAGMMVDILTSIIMSDLNKITVDDPSSLADTWDAISKDNKFEDILAQAIADTLVEGDGAFKISFDKNVTDYPIIEFYPASRVKYEYSRGRVEAVIFSTRYYVEDDRKEYYLEERYGKNRIDYKLFDKDGNEHPLSAVPALAEYKPIEWSDDFVMAVPMMFYKSAKFTGRGRSIFDRKIDCFDAYDEAISQWQDALRLGRVKRYIPETMIPRDPNTGKLIAPNPFDNQFTALASMNTEGAKEQIVTDVPTIDYDGLLKTYVNTLDMCLQGIVSPSTLGIDVKKLDNAEAQREKEKVTLYTRNKIIDVLNDVIPNLVKNVMSAYGALTESPIDVVEASITFGEYANPSFEAQVETLAKATQSSLMSVETMVEELWGDTKDEEWKKEEVARIKAEKGIIDGGEEPPPEVM